MAGSGPQSLVRNVWSTLVCVQLLFIVGSVQAARMLQQQAPQQRRLRAYSDDTVIPRHAPPVQSFLLSDGSWVDCIPIEGQISAHHPALTDHVIQMTPTSRRSSDDHPQLFAREYGACPEGSIPVQRPDPNRPLHQKTQCPLASAAYVGDGNGTHEYAITGLPTVEGGYTGCSHILSVNNPVLGIESNDFSLSQVWIVDGTYGDGTLSTIESGWQKFPSGPQEQPSGNLDAPHLFVYWTADAYKTTGCYDLTCPGFVQTSNSWVLGGPMPNYTSLADNAANEDELALQVLYDPTSTNWILSLNGEQIGYWPSSIYQLNSRLQGSAQLIQWGGEVYFKKDEEDPTLHTLTTMGSGAFPSAGYPKAAYYKNITYADATGTFFNADPTVLTQQESPTNRNCYDIEVGPSSTDAVGTFFYFGGSGGNNPSCVYQS